MVQAMVMLIAMVVLVVMLMVVAGVTVANTLGRREFAGTDDCGSQGNGQWNPITREWFSYSVRGELTDVYELTPNSGGFYHTTAGYAPNGALTSLGLPAAAGSWTYTLDGEGRPFSATNGSTVNVASVTYNVASQPLSTGITISRNASRFGLRRDRETQEVGLYW
jgi:hypothetical protein